MFFHPLGREDGNGAKSCLLIFHLSEESLFGRGCTCLCLLLVLVIYLALSCYLCPPPPVSREEVKAEVPGPFLASLGRGRKQRLAGPGLRSQTPAPNLQGLAPGHGVVLSQ